MWAKQTSLYDLLNDKYNNSDPAHIEDTIEMLQGAISFGLPALLRPVYEARGVDASILTYIEAGAYHPIVRKMIDLGISREPALRLYAMVKARSGINHDASYFEIVNAIKGLKDSIPFWTRIQVPFLTE